MAEGRRRIGRLPLWVENTAGACGGKLMKKSGGTVPGTLCKPGYGSQSMLARKSGWSNGSCGGNYSAVTSAEALSQTRRVIARPRTSMVKF